MYGKLDGVTKNQWGESRTKNLYCYWKVDTFVLEKKKHISNNNNFL